MRGGNGCGLKGRAPLHRKRARPFRPHHVGVVSPALRAGLRERDPSGRRGYRQSIAPRTLASANFPLSVAMVFGFLPSASATIRNPSVSLLTSSPESVSFLRISSSSPTHVYATFLPSGLHATPHALALSGNSGSASRFRGNCPTDLATTSIRYTRWLHPPLSASLRSGSASMNSTVLPSGESRASVGRLARSRRSHSTVTSLSPSVTMPSSHFLAFAS